MYRIIISLLVLLLGAALLAGGVWLAAVGGSWFYVLLGLGLIVSAVLTFMRRPAGLAIYGLTLLVTLGWAVWEVGFDWWALSARGSLLMVLGVLVALPPMVWAMHRPGAPRGGYGASAAVLGLGIVVSALVGVYSMFQSPHDTAGAFDDTKMAATSDV